MLPLVCAGYPNKAIAAELGVSTRAVTRRLTRLMRLFAVDNGVALVGAVLAAGLVDVARSKGASSRGVLEGASTSARRLTLRIIVTLGWR